MQNLPGDMGVMIIAVNKLRLVATVLHEISPHYTVMPVHLMTDGLRLAPDEVFILPEKHDLHVENGVFRLEPISKPHGWPNVITVFLRSLAKNWRGRISR